MLLYLKFCILKAKFLDKTGYHKKSKEFWAYQGQSDL